MDVNWGNISLKNVLLYFSLYNYRVAPGKKYMKITPEKTSNEPAVEQKAKDKVPSYAHSPRGFFIELVKIVVIAVVVIIPVRYFLFQPFYVRGASMEPNFHDNEYLIIDEITYRFNDPQRGEVVVVHDPKNDREYLIKRIIGLPGETVLIDGGRVSIKNDQHPDGFLLDEPYLFDTIVTNGNKEVSLGGDQYYVLGDNRPVSLDSRNFGPVTSREIVGRAWIRVWPFDTFAHFTVPQYEMP